MEAQVIRCHRCWTALTTFLFGLNATRMEKAAIAGGQIGCQVTSSGLLFGGQCTWAQVQQPHCGITPESGNTSDACSLEHDTKMYMYLDALQSLSKLHGRHMVSPLWQDESWPWQAGSIQLSSHDSSLRHCHLHEHPMAFSWGTGPR